MGDKSKIEWTDATWNPVTGCTNVSEGCRNCYARKVTEGWPGLKGKGAFDKVIFHPDRLDQPLKWRRPRKIFVCSMSDLFHEDVPEEFIREVMAYMANSSRHTFQILTKRPRRMKEFLTKYWNSCYRDAETEKFIPVPPSRHIWFGVSVEDQKTADERIPLLLDAPAAVRWVSYEPALGPVDFTMALEQFQSHDPMLNRQPPPVQWIVMGGESGPGARPMHPDWARSVRDQCQAAGVPFFFKQWGEWAPMLYFGEGRQCGMSPHSKERFIHSDGYECYHDICEDRVGMFKSHKKYTGAMLDGREWREFPK